MDPVVILLVAIAAVATASLIAFWVMTRDQPPGFARRRVRARRPGGFDDATEVVEPPAFLSVDEVAYRIGVLDAPAPAPFIEATASVADAVGVAAAARAAAAGHAKARASAGRAVVSTSVVAEGSGSGRGDVVRPAAPMATRERLVRDAGIALIVLTVVGLVAFFVLPHGPTVRPSGSANSVVRAGGSPRPSSAQTSPSATDQTGIAAFTVTPEPSTAEVTAARVGATAKPAVRFQDTSTAVHYGGPWTTSSNAGALGGSHRYTSAAGASVTFTRSMRDISWMATRTRTSGTAQVWIDGSLAATVNLRAGSTLYRQSVFHRDFGAVGTHTIEIRSLGGGRVYFDAFAILQ